MDNRYSVLLRSGATVLVAALAISGCDGGRSALDPENPEYRYTGTTPLVLPGPGDGVVFFETFEVCKTGSDGDFTYSVTDKVSGAVVRSGTITIADGTCSVLALAGGTGQDVTVTEVPRSGYRLDRVDVTVLTNAGTSNTTIAGPTVTDSVGGSKMAGGLRGVVATYVNEAIVPPPPTRVTLCKVGSAADFTVSVDGTPTDHSLGNGSCQLVNYHQGGTADQTVVLTEHIPTGYTLDSIVVLDGLKYTGVSSATVTSGDAGDVTVTFYNSQIIRTQGCTPGYWKQRQHFDSWAAPYTPSTLFSDVFTNAFPGKSLLQVLGQGGGGLNALGRHAVAALLNAASSGVPYNYAAPADVINAFNAAFASGSYETQKNLFEGYNEQGCPLN